MYIKTAALVLQQLPYSDSRTIVKMFTKELGMQTYMVAGTKGKKNNKAAYFQPMQLLEIVATHYENRSFQHIKEKSLLYVYRTLPLQPYKSAVAIFANEILLKSLSDAAGSAMPLFDFVNQWLLDLDDSTDSLANYPIRFLIHLTSYLGIDPINNFNESTPVFCIRDGKFVAEGEVAEQHVLFSKEESVIMHALLSDEMLDISRIKRNNVLDALIRYYQYHVPGFHACKTAEVLHQVFES